MADVQVTFGANIESLISSVDQVKGAINSIAGIVGVAFSASAIEGFVSQMESLATQTERTSSILGLSTTETQQLGLMAQVTGGSTQGMATAIERFEVSLQRAQVSTSLQAHALAAFGLSARDLISLPLPEQMARFADAVSKFADGTNKAAALGALSRGFVEFTPVLDKGRAGIESLNEQFLNAGAIMSGPTIEALDRMGTQSTVLWASLKTLGGTLLALSSTQLGSFASALTTTAANLTSLASSGNLASYVFGYMDTVLTGLGYRFVQIGTAIKDLVTLNFGEIGKNWEAGTKAMLDAEGPRLADLNAMLSQATENYKSLLAASNQTEKPQVGALAIPDNSALKAQAEQYDAMVKQADGAYAVLKEQYSTDAAVHRITTDQETAQLQSALSERWALEQSVFEAKKALYASEPAQLAAVWKQETAAYQQYLKEHQGLTDTQLKADVAEWNSLLSPVLGAWNSQLRSLLAGTETFATAMRKIFGDLVIQVIEYFEKIAVEKAALGLATSLNAGPQSLLGGLLGGGGQVAATTANTGALTALTTAVAALTTVFTGGTVATTAQTTATVAETTATTAETAAQVGSGGSGLFSGLAGLTALLGFDVGSDMITRSGLAIVHQGNTITPARSAGPYRGGDGGDVHVHMPLSINAVDRRSIERMFNENGGALLKAINAAARRGAHTGLRMARA